MGSMTWEQLFEGMESADGLFVVDSKQRIVHWSQSATSILGHAPEAIVGRQCYDVFNNGCRNNNVCRENCAPVTNARRNRTSRDYDLLCKAKDGSWRWLNFSTLISVRPGSGAVTLHLFRDVTHLRELQEHARRTAGVLRRDADDGQNGADAKPAANETPTLSRRESEVLRLLAAGMSTRDIAEALGVKHVTARNHVTRLLKKLGSRTRLQAVVSASRQGLL